MIDKNVFKHEWVQLCERFRMTGSKEPSETMVRRYYEYLNQRLSTEEFQKAAARIYSEAEFFPKPADFVAGTAAEIDLEVAALDAWDDVTRLLRDFSNPLSSLDAPARRAVEVMGGLRAIGGSVSGLDFRRREFIEHYQRFAAAIERDPMHALPPDERRSLTRGADPERLQIGPAGREVARG